MLLPPKARCPDGGADAVARLLDRVAPDRRLTLLPPRLHLCPSLYHLLPYHAILSVLQQTGTQSQRLRRLPAHDVVWLVIGQALCADRSIPKVWRHLHPSTAVAEPAPSAFTQARQRLGARPLQLLFHRVCRPLATPALPDAFWGPWRVMALDGTALEAPDTPANRRVLGAAANQHGPGAFPQLHLQALCEVGSHAVTDVERGSYRHSELALSLRLLKRLPAGCLVLMDRGLSYYEVIRAVARRRGVVLARVKAQQRALPVERVLPDGSYLSTIYPSSNDRRARRRDRGLRVRVVRYTHDDPARDGCGEESCLLTTVLSPGQLSAWQALRLYPWRWEEESVFAEVKGTLRRGGQPLLRGKTPTLVTQEVYGLLLGHYLPRRVMAQAACVSGVGATRLSCKHSLEVWEDRLKDVADERWLSGLVGEVSRQKLGPKRLRRYPRQKKATRSRWPNKKPGSKPPPQPTQPFDKTARIVLSVGH